jgi:hypothetical protein
VRLAAHERPAYLQLASMVSWFSVFSRVRELSDEPENHCSLLSELRWQQLLTRFVEGDVAVIADAGEKKLYATVRLNAILIPVPTSGSAKSCTQSEIDAVPPALLLQRCGFTIAYVSVQNVHLKQSHFWSHVAMRSN